jgi:hypothetical protein
MNGPRKHKADGDTWIVRLGERAEREGFRTVLFFCETTNQRPYRVVEVPEESIKGPDDLQALDGATIAALFDASRSLGYPQRYE